VPEIPEARTRSMAVIAGVHRLSERTHTSALRRARGQTAAAPRRLLLLLLRLAPPPAPCCTALAANDDSLHRAAVDRTARNRRDFPLPARAIRGHQTVVIASSVPQ